MQRIKKTFSLITRNPALFFALAWGKVRIAFASLSPLSIGKKVHVGDVVFALNPSRNLTPEEIIEKQIGTYETAIVSVMRSVLKKGDIFIDVGANIGYLSVVGAMLVGEEGEVHGFEPVPDYYNDAKMVADMNKSYAIVMNNFALGEKEEILEIQAVAEPFIGNSTFLPELLSDKMEKKSVSVPVRRLDRYIDERIRDKNRIALIKIDVEGFESAVLRGLEGFFKNGYRPVIICEIRPLSGTRLGFSVAALSEYMQAYDYEAYRVETPKRAVSLNEITQEVNVVFRPKTK